ncbi:uncharacterized protein JCM10292_001634 [Rhodotorula paludigena]|uniref:uncharacterized protein n=1 Tax=Rhodotorula paludigena TaxID=86838 RepID=UPI00316EA25D
MLTRLPALRTALPRSAAARPLHTTVVRRTTHPAKNDLGNSVGEDTADIQRKNAAVPLFVAAGAALVGYIAYSQISAGQAAKAEKKEAKHDQEKSKPVLGEKEKMSMRG